MKAYHVTSKKKFIRYVHTGCIEPPVRAWTTIQEAERFSCQTGRCVIIRLSMDSSFSKLEGHAGMAVVSDKRYLLDKM